MAEGPQRRSWDGGGPCKKGAALLGGARSRPSARVSAPWGPPLTPLQGGVPSAPPPLTPASAWSRRDAESPRAAPRMKGRAGTSGAWAPRRVRESPPGSTQAATQAAAGHASERRARGARQGEGFRLPGPQACSLQEQPVLLHPGFKEMLNEHGAPR